MQFYQRRERGYSLIEALAFVALIGGLLLANGMRVASLTRHKVKVLQQQRAYEFAQNQWALAVATLALGQVGAVTQNLVYQCTQDLCSCTSANCTGVLCLQNAGLTAACLSDHSNMYAQVTIQPVTTAGTHPLQVEVYTNQQRQVQLSAEVAP